MENDWRKEVCAYCLEPVGVPSRESIGEFLTDCFSGMIINKMQVI